MSLSRKTLAAAFGIAALIAFPAGAGAQSAGDEQYSDPLEGQSQDQGGSDNSGSGNSGSQGSAPSGSSGAGPSSQGSSSGSASQSQSGSGTTELARTGFPAGLLALGGAAIAGAGFGLRRRSRS